MGLLFTPKMLKGLQYFSIDCVRFAAGASSSCSWQELQQQMGAIPD